MLGRPGLFASSVTNIFEHVFIGAHSICLVMCADLSRTCVVHLYLHIYIYEHTCIHIHVYTCTYTCHHKLGRRRNYVLRLTHMQTLAYPCIYEPTHTHQRTHTHKQTLIPWCYGFRTGFWTGQPRQTKPMRLKQELPQTLLYMKARR